MTQVKIFDIAAMPRQVLLDGAASRSALTTDNSIVTFNWIELDCIRLEPHSHPFDQLSLVLSGQMLFEIGEEEHILGPGTAVRIPPGVPHTASPLGDEVILNVDIFAPAREDYLFLAEHQVTISGDN